MSDHDIEKCSYEPGAAKALIKEGVFVLSASRAPSTSDPAALQNIYSSKLLQPGLVLVQSPYDTDTYEDASTASNNFALAKHMLFSTFCALLGAKEVSVKQVDARNVHGATTLEIKGERLSATGNANVKSEELDKFRSHISLEDKFGGGEPDVHVAELFLRSKGLWADQTLRSLLELRKIPNNQMRSRKVSIDLSSEVKRTLGVIGQINIPAFVKLSTDYKKAVSEQYEYTLTANVSF